MALKERLIKKTLGITELPIIETEEKVIFPWFSVKPADKDAVTAYTHFIYSFCEMARNQKRVHGVEKEVENEKYAFRCFLLRLGFIGDQLNDAVITEHCLVETWHSGKQIHSLYYPIERVVPNIINTFNYICGWQMEQVLSAFPAWEEKLKWKKSLADLPAEAVWM